MSITTTIEAGKVVLPPGLNWPDGTIVRVEQILTSEPTLYDSLKEFDGVVDDLPSDFALNHDHYLHGHPKK